MKHLYAFITLLLTAAIIAAAIPVSPVLANNSDLIDRATQERNELQKKLSQQKNQSRNLAEEISYMNNQIRLRELEIQDTQQQIQTMQSLITQANAEITTVTARLDKLQKVMDQKEAAALARLREAYKKSLTSKLGTIFSSSDFQGAMRNYEYLKLVEQEDSEVLAEMVESKKNFQEQRANLQKVKKEKEALQSKLLAQEEAVKSKQSQLRDDKSAQTALLNKSKNNEAYYSDLLAQKEAELRAYASAVAAPGQQRFYVVRGQVIAYQGNTGCSTGSHLHFGYRKVNLGTYLGGWNNAISTGRWLDPIPYINNGTLAKPLGSYTISQSFGANAAGIVDYGPQGHPAVDIYSYYGAPIFAAESGWAQRMTDSGCGTGPGKGIIITHANGSQTLYWHIQ